MKRILMSLLVLAAVAVAGGDGVFGDSLPTGSYIMSVASGIAEVTVIGPLMGIQFADGRQMALIKVNIGDGKYRYEDIFGSGWVWFDFDITVFPYSEGAAQAGPNPPVALVKVP